MTTFCFPKNRSSAATDASTMASLGAGRTNFTMPTLTTGVPTILSQGPAVAALTASGTRTSVGAVLSASASGSASISAVGRSAVSGSSQAQAAEPAIRRTASTPK